MNNEKITNEEEKCIEEFSTAESKQINIDKLVSWLETLEPEPLLYIAKELYRDALNKQTDQEIYNLCESISEEEEEESSETD